MNQPIQEFYDLNATGDQRAVIDLLRGLGRKEQEILDLVNAGYRTLREGRGFLAVPIALSDGTSQPCNTPCTDLDDLRVICKPLEERAAGIRRQIGIALVEAVRLGMGELPFVRNTLEYYTTGYQADALVPR